MAVGKLYTKEYGPTSFYVIKLLNTQEYGLVISGDAYHSHFELREHYVPSPDEPFDKYACHLWPDVKLSYAKLTNFDPFKEQVCWLQDISQAKVTFEYAVWKDGKVTSYAPDGEYLIPVLPATPTQFEELQESVLPLLLEQSDDPDYAFWMRDFTRQICDSLTKEELNKVASGIIALGKEKLEKEEREKKAEDPLELPT